jgi:hypothetical protein
VIGPLWTVAHGGELQPKLQPEPSAWEVCGAADLLPADFLTRGLSGVVSASDRDWLRLLVRSGTQRAWTPQIRSLGKPSRPVHGWPSSGPMFQACGIALVAGHGLGSSCGSSRAPACDRDGPPASMSAVSAGECAQEFAGLACLVVGCTLGCKGPACARTGVRAGDADLGAGERIRTADLPFTSGLACGPERPSCANGPTVCSESTGLPRLLWLLVPRFVPRPSRRAAKPGHEA